MPVEIQNGHDHLDDIAALFEEYKRCINVDVSFQPNDTLPEEIACRYAEPQGRIYIAYVDGIPAGCLAFHPMTQHGDAELKRFFTRPPFRGQHIGHLLMECALTDILRLGYRRVYLDTLAVLKAACRLYEKFGFEKIAPYYNTPLPNVVYYRRSLSHENSMQ